MPMLSESWSSFKRVLIGLGKGNKYRGMLVAYYGKNPARFLFHSTDKLQS